MTRLRGPSAGLLLAAAFLIAYFAARHVGLRPALCEVLSAGPAAWAAVVLLRQARRESGADRRFLGLLALSALVWLLGQALWTLAVARGEEPQAGHFPLLDLLFIGFTVPTLAAALGRPRGESVPAEAMERLELALLVTAVSLVFLRLLLLPLAGYEGARGFRAMLLACLCLATAALSVAHVVLGDDDGARRRYALLAFFALSYGIGSGLANGLGTMPAPGGPLDLAWFVPFFFLAAIGGGDRRGWGHLQASQVLWIVGSLPLVLELFAHLLSADPPAGREVVVAFAVVLSLGGAALLQVQGRTNERRLVRDREHLETERRSGRLESLASVARPLLADLRRTMDVLSFRAAVAESALGSEASSVGDQVERALLLIGEIEGALNRSPSSRRQVVDLPPLVECVLGAEVDRGLALSFRVVAAPSLPRVRADLDAFSSAVRELARNAAQASPPARLEVRIRSEGAFVVLEFADDGPGIPEPIRRHVFDPFFTTRRVGEGVGLGLTLVHFVSLEMGGSVRLDPAEGHATSVVLRVPADEHPPRAARARIFVYPILALAALLTLVSVAPAHAGGLVRAATAAVSFLAAGLLARAAWGASFRSLFFRLLALGALLPGAEALFGLRLSFWADWPWAMAVLVASRPGGETASPRRRAVPWLGFGVYLAAHAGIVLLDPAAPPAQSSEFASSFLRLVLASAAAAAAVRIPEAPLRRGLEGLALALALWALAAAAGTWASWILPPGDLPLRDLGAFLPLLILAGLGRAEGRRERVPAQGAPA